MSKLQESLLNRIPAADWAATPASVQALVKELVGTVEHLQGQLEELSDQFEPLIERVSELEEKLSKNSKNSSKPPSSDGFGKSIKPKGKGGKRQRGGQPDHRGHQRELYPIERCDEVLEHYPSACNHCGYELSGEDPAPYRHQVVELPPIVPIVTEHRLHRLLCPHCGAGSRARLPQGVASGYGHRLSGVVSLLSGSYRLSHQRMVSLLRALFDIDLSCSSVNRLRRELSEALFAPVSAAQRYVQSSPVIHSDETGFSQGNSDGHNPTGKRGWLWVMATPLVSYFEVFLSRSKASAQTFLGRSVSGIVVSDRCSSYNWIEYRQVCWAHLKRDFTAIAQRSGASQEIGEALLRRQRRLFRLWHNVRDGTLTRTQFQQAVAPLRRGLKRELEIASQLINPKGDKTPLAKTVRTCQQILKVEPALWTFVDTPGVEPTNNTAERALRPAVIWRRTSFGSQSLAGSQFVARMLTVVTSLNAQNRPVLEFLTQTYQAARLGDALPSLLPQVNLDAETSILS